MRYLSVRRQAYGKAHKKEGFKGCTWHKKAEPKAQRRNLVITDL